MKLVRLFVLALGSARLGLPDVSLVIPSNTGAPAAYWAANNGPSDGVSDSYFWDHVSNDGPFCNIGYFLNGSVQAATGCINSQGNPTFNPPGSPNLPFLSSSQDGSVPPPAFYFIPNSPVIAVDVAGFRYDDVQTFGYYLESAPNTMIQLFAGNAPTSTAAFSPSGAFGFYLTTIEGNVWTTTGDPGQFALFDSDPNIAGSAAAGTSLTDFWIGAKDFPIPGGDRDYNDTIIHVIASAPEPRYFVLVGLGILGIWFSGKRRRKAAAVASRHGQSRHS
jgi:hypothetical protein